MSEPIFSIEVGPDDDGWFVRYQGVEYRCEDKAGAIAMVRQLLEQAMHA